MQNTSNKHKTNLPCKQLSWIGIDRLSIGCCAIFHVLKAIICHTKEDKGIVIRRFESKNVTATIREKGGESALGVILGSIGGLGVYELACIDSACPVFGIDAIAGSLQLGLDGRHDRRLQRIYHLSWSFHPAVCQRSANSSFRL